MFRTNDGEEKLGNGTKNQNTSDILISSNLSKEHNSKKEEVKKVEKVYSNQSTATKPPIPAPRAINQQTEINDEKSNGEGIYFLGIYYLS